MPKISFGARSVSFTYDPNRSRHWLAVADIMEAASLWRLARSLGWLDIRLRYRGSMLGPFWLTISTLVMVISLGVLYSALFHIDVHDYLPFLALSQVLWFFIAAIVTDACLCFVQAEGMIHSARMPMFLHAMHTLVRNVIILAHNIVVIVGVFVYFSIWPGVTGLMALPGLLLWAVDSLAICLLLGAFCARFRDISPIVGSIMQIAFFMSPIIWKPEMIGAHMWMLPFNPFFDLLEIVRAPLLGQMPMSDVWPAALGYSLGLCAMAWALFVRARSRIAFWI